jgi:hypothetical protein
MSCDLRELCLENCQPFRVWHLRSNFFEVTKVLGMVPARSSLSLLLALASSSHGALLNIISQRASTKRVRALIAPVISAAPALPEPERVDTYWKQDDSALSRRLARMLEATPSLQQPTYQPTTWAKGSKANFALAFARSRAGELRRKVEPPLSEA